MENWQSGLVHIMHKENIFLVDIEEGKDIKPEEQTLRMALMSKQSGYYLYAK